MTANDMAARDLVLVVAATLCCIGFAALVVVLMRVLDTLRSLRAEIESLRAETTPLLSELRHSTTEARAAVAEARNDLDRFDRVLGSAEAISSAVHSGSIVTRAALSAPVIKTVAAGSGLKRGWRRLRRVRRKQT